MEWRKENYLISDDKKLLDIGTIYELLSKTYWASDRPRKIIELSIQNSISLGLFHNGKQIGFARAITDKVVSSWLLDVVIHEDFRSKGLGKWLIECVLDHPDIKYTTVNLATKDAHEFYEKFHFKNQQFMRKKHNSYRPKLSETSISADS